MSIGKIGSSESPNRHGKKTWAEEFHGKNKEESDKEKLWLEKLPRIL